MAIEERERDSHDAAYVIANRTLKRKDLVALIETRHRYWLVDCDLGDLDASDLHMPGWSFENCTTLKAQFSQANLESTYWRRCKGGFTNFGGADLSDSLIVACDLNNSDFTKAALTDVAFERSRLIGIVMADNKSLRLVIEKCLLGASRLTGISFKKQTLVGLDFLAATLSECDFQDAYFDGECSLIDADLQGCKFKGADLRMARLGSMTPARARDLKGGMISFEHAAHLAMGLGLEVGEVQ